MTIAEDIATVVDVVRELAAETGDRWVVSSDIATMLRARKWSSTRGQGTLRNARSTGALAHRKSPTGRKNGFGCVATEYSIPEVA